MPIIQSTVDTDAYKCFMQAAILKYRQGVPVEYRFVNRRKEGRFNQEFMTAFESELHEMKYLTCTTDQLQFFGKRCPFLEQSYIDYLGGYQFDPNQIEAKLVNGELEMSIKGTWERTILWEVPLMALISELYFTHCDTEWSYNVPEIIARTEQKAVTLQKITFSDFGTRRRRSAATQNLVVSTLAQCREHAQCFNFVGTSNVHFAHKYGLQPRGTMAHEWIMGISALEGLRHANRYALKIWADIFGGRCGTALADTFGSDAFFADFDGFLARVYDSIRHDSGDPITFAWKAIDRYLDLGINPLSKSIIFSDGLDAPKCVDIHKQIHGSINCGFGIGTNLTNDFPGSKPLNMVIKLVRCNGIPVVKLGDDVGKAIGERDAIRVSKYVFFNTPLDNEG